LNDSRRGLLRTLGVAAGVTAVAAVASHTLPESFAATGVGFTFLLAAYWLVIRGDDTERIREFGLSLGGLLEPQPLSWSRIGRDALQAIGLALLAAVIIFPFYWFGFRIWWNADAFRPAPLLPKVLGLPTELLVIALPEEAFYRGYLQTSFDRHLGKRFSILGVRFGPGLLLTSVIFALGHLLTIFNPTRLAVFFPSVVFGLLRERSGGIGAALLFHALCNLYSGYLLESYGLLR
jgi:membrane protease YdiL (CAAX protease family)